MTLSRRNFLRTAGTGAAVGAVFPLGELVSAAMFEPRRSGEPGVIRLNSNENPYGPSAKTVAAIRDSISIVNRYPFGEYEGLVEQIARYHNIKDDRLIVGCGSSEVLRMAAMAFLSSGKQLVQASPTFEVMDHYAHTLGAEVVSVPLDRSFAHDLEGMLGRVGSSTTLVYICNPNNPTASITPRKDLETFIAKLPPNCFVLIDEAYHHFADSPAYASFIDHPIDDDRVIVSRTFSKIYGLAGLRLGYGIASPAVATRLNGYITADNLNGIVIRAGIASLQDQPSADAFVKRNAAARQEFAQQAAARTLRPIDSQANFSMMNTNHPVEELIQHFKKHNILIGRRFPAMENYIRVSFGTPEEMQAFWRAWDLLPFATMARFH